jgi:hypothetical protein
MIAHCMLFVPYVMKLQTGAAFVMRGLTHGCNDALHKPNCCYHIMNVSA